jgi:hypothetical protein
MINACVAARVACLSVACAAAAAARGQDSGAAFSFDFPSGELSASARSVVNVDLFGTGTPGLLVVGGFATAGGQTANGVAYWSEDRWFTFGAGLSGPAGTFNPLSVAVADLDGDGEPEMIVGGLFDHAGGNPAANIAMYKDGAWQAMGAGLGDPASGETVKQVRVIGGSVYACGSFSTSGLAPVVGISRWDGAAWQPVGGNTLNTGVECVAGYDDQLGGGEKIFVGGSFSAPGGGRLARLDGNAWSLSPELVVGGGSSSRVTSLCVYNPTAPAGKPLLIVGGKFTSAGGQTRSNIAAFDGVGFSDLGGGIVVASAFPPVTSMVVGPSNFGAGPGSSLYVAGTLTSAGGGPVDELAEYRGATGTWHNVPADAGEPADDIVFVPGGEGGGPGVLVAAGIGSVGISRLTAHGWAPLTDGVVFGGSTVRFFEPLNPAPSAGDYPGGLLVGGDFQARAGDGAWSSNLMRLPGDETGGLPGLAVMPDPGLGFYDMQFLPAGSDAAPAGGIFGGGIVVNECGGVAGVIRSNQLTQNQCVGTFKGFGTPRNMRMLELNGQPRPYVFITGSFEEGGGKVKNRNCAMYDAAAGVWRDREFAYPNGPVFSTAVGDVDGDGHDEVFMGGSFSNLEGDGGVTPAGNWAIRDGSGGVFVDSTLALNGSTLTALIDGTQTRAGVPFGLYIGGEFTAQGTTTLNRVARWDGAAWQALGSGLDGRVRAMAVWDARDGLGPNLYVGGDFAMAGGVPCARLARWDGTAWRAVVDGVENGVNGAVHALQVWDARDGKGPSLYVGGAFTLAGGRSSSRIGRLVGGPNPCPADVNWSGEVDLEDYFQWFNWWDVTDPRAELDGEPGVDLGDFFAFFAHWDVSC